MMAKLDEIERVSLNAAFVLFKLSFDTTVRRISPSSLRASLLLKISLQRRQRVCLL